MDLQTLRTLKRNKKELVNAEEKILYAIALDCSRGILTEPIVTEKVFEISSLIEKVNAKIEECREILKKNKK